MPEGLNIGVQLPGESIAVAIIEALKVRRETMDEGLRKRCDTIYVETEVLEMRASASKPDRGLVRLRHIGKNQAGMVVIELERTVLFLKRPI